MVLLLVITGVAPRGVYLKSGGKFVLLYSMDFSSQLTSVLKGSKLKVKCTIVQVFFSKILCRCMTFIFAAIEPLSMPTTNFGIAIANLIIGLFVFWGYFARELEVPCSDAFVVLTVGLLTLTLSVFLPKLFFAILLL